MTADPDDPVSATLAAIRKRADWASDRYAEVSVLRESLADVPALLAAVEAALKRHESRVPVRILAEYGSDEAERYRYCSTCSGHPAWPCPEVRAITSALAGTGKEGSEDG